MPAVFLSAEWRSLVMLNYPVSPEIVLPYVPRGVELDLWQGQAMVSMVGFMFLDCRVLGVPVPWHRNFEEVNLRLYVRRVMDGEVRRGVVFVKEIVPKLAIAALARGLYNESYVAMPMRHTLDGPKVEYGWRMNGTWQSLSALCQGSPEPLGAGSEAEFICEHYWGYSRQRDGGTVEYQVEHPPWRAWAVESSRLDCDVERLYGRAFAPALSVPPQSAFVAEGSPIQVRWGQRIA